MSEPDLYANVNVLNRNLIYLINCKKSVFKISDEEVKKAKNTIQELLTELNQHLGLDICQFPNENPGFTD